MQNVHITFAGIAENFPIILALRSVFHAVPRSVLLEALLGPDEWKTVIQERGK
jgi:hypothetical protein